MNKEETAYRMSRLSEILLEMDGNECATALRKFIRNNKNASKNPPLRLVRSWFGIPNPGSPSAPYQSLIVDYILRNTKPVMPLEELSEKMLNALFHDETRDHLESLINICSPEKHSHFASIYHSNAMKTDVDNLTYFDVMVGEWMIYRLHSSRLNSVVRELLVIAEPTRTTAVCHLHSYQIQAPIENERREKLIGTAYPIYSNKDIRDKRLQLIVGAPSATENNFFSLSMIVDTRAAFYDTAIEKEILPAFLLGLSDLHVLPSAGPVFLRKVVRSTNENASAEFALVDEIFVNGARDEEGKPRKGVVTHFEDGEVYDYYYEPLDKLKNHPNASITEIGELFNE